jgi:hypothetical protein
MATGALDANGIWQYGEDDSNTTFSALINRLGSSTSTQMAKALYTGRVIQTVTETYATTVNSTSTSFVTSGLQAAITPRFASSKILIMVTGSSSHANAGSRVSETLYRGGSGGTNLGSGNGMATQYQANGETVTPFSIIYLDSPATTSSTTYTLMYKSHGGNCTIQDAGATSSIVLMEVTA